MGIFVDASSANDRINRSNSTPNNVYPNLSPPKTAPACPGANRRLSVWGESHNAIGRGIPESAEYIPPPQYSPPVAEAVAAMGGCMPAPLQYAGEPPPYAES